MNFKFLLFSPVILALLVSTTFAQDIGDDNQSPYVQFALDLLDLNGDGIADELDLLYASIVANGFDGKAHWGDPVLQSLDFNGDGFLNGYFVDPVNMQGAGDLRVYIDMKNQLRYLGSEVWHVEMPFEELPLNHTHDVLLGTDEPIGGHPWNWQCNRLGDANNDGAVKCFAPGHPNFDDEDNDYGIVWNNLGLRGHRRSDVNGDGKTDDFDLRDVEYYSGRH